METGLGDFGRRYYSATLGRWLNRDPLGDLGGANVYAYVANNPTNRTDYLGLKAVVCPYLDTDPSRCGPQGGSTPSSGEPDPPQEENDKKPCPKDGQGTSGPPVRENENPFDWCRQTCSGYADVLVRSACLAGCGNPGRGAGGHRRATSLRDCTGWCSGQYTGAQYSACVAGCWQGASVESDKTDGTFTVCCSDSSAPASVSSYRMASCNPGQNASQCCASLNGPNMARSKGWVSDYQPAPVGACEAAGATSPGITPPPPSCNTPCIRCFAIVGVATNCPAAAACIRVNGLDRICIPLIRNCVLSPAAAPIACIECMMCLGV